MQLKPTIWMGSSRKDLLSMPKTVRDEMGYALFEAQAGGKSDKAKPLTGLGSAGILEIVEDDRGEPIEPFIR